MDGGKCLIEKFPSDTNISCIRVKGENHVNVTYGS